MTGCSRAWDVHFRLISLWPLPPDQFGEYSRSDPDLSTSCRALIIKILKASKNCFAQLQPGTFSDRLSLNSFLRSRVGMPSLTLQRRT